MLNMSKNFDISQKVIWNFFGSRHGKNKSDGKSTVKQSQLDIVTHAKEDSPRDTALKCYAYLTGSPLASPLSSTARRHFCFVNKDDIDVERISIPDVICGLPKVRQINQISRGLGDVYQRRMSCYCTENSCQHSSIPIEKLAGQFYLLSCAHCLVAASANLRF